MKIRLKRLNHKAELPEYATNEAAGMDITSTMTIVLEPGKFAAISTGIALEIPPGTEVQVRPRSGLAFKHGVTILNAPGTIDSDYRGEIKVLLVNHGSEPFEIKEGDRIAQLVFSNIVRVTGIEVATDDLSNTDRGTKGLGSTGIQGRPSLPKSLVTGPEITTAKEPRDFSDKPAKIKNYVVKNLWENKIALNSNILAECRETNTTLRVTVRGEKGQMLLTPADLEAKFISRSKKTFPDKIHGGPDYYLSYYNWRPERE